MTDTKRPLIKIEPSSTDRILDTTAILGLLFMVAATAVYYPKLPQIIPTHFDFAGKVDGWGPKWSLLFLPALGAVMYVGMSIAARYPHTFNYPVPITEENAERQYRIAVSAMCWIKMEIILLFTVLDWQILQAVLSKDARFNPAIVLAFVGAIVLTTAALVVQAYRAR